jgi:DNA end-binding protein Ku
MPRSIWNGTVSVGLVSVPISLHSATESKTVHFREVHEKDGAPIEHRRVCSKEDKEVPYTEVVKGFEIRKGEYAVLTKEEVAAAAGERTKVIDVEEFVDASKIDPVYFDKAYHLGARDGGEQAYRLLHDAMEQCGRAGIGRFVFHNREYLVAIRPVDGVLAMHTLRFADEVVEPDEIDVPEPAKKPSKREVDMAAALVDSLHEPFKPEKYEDTHRKAVLKLVEQKARGKKIEVPEPEQPEPADDLMKALAASLEGGKK